MRLLILGAGGYGQTIADIARQSGRYTQVCFLDDGKIGAEILGKCAEYKNFEDGATQFYPAFGNNTGRIEWLNRFKQEGVSVPTLVHPTAYVSPMAQVEEGSVVLPRAVINTGSVVKRGCIVNCGAIVDHGCVLEEGVHLAPGAIVKAENRIPSCTKVESGEVIQNCTYPVR